MINKQADSHVLHNVIFAFLTFALSCIVSPYYTGGDQEHYTGFYNIIKNMGIVEGYIQYNKSLGSIEPVYYIIIFITSRFLDKILFISIINGLMGYLLYYNLNRLNVNRIIIYSLLLNFYFVVLLFSAERLKFSLTFLLLALATTHLFKSYALLFFSALSHVQSAIIIFVIKFDSVKNDLRRRFKENHVLKIFIVFFVLFVIVAVLYLLKDYIILKFEANTVKRSVFNLIKPGMFMMLSIFFGKNDKLKVLFAFTPLMLISYLIGSERIVIFCFFIFCYYAFQVKKGLNIITIIILMYFIFKGFEFIYNIINYGNGFYKF